jgi:transcription termination factor Rho
MDDVIYEEFKGTGNMEVHLDRRLSERRVYPSIDVGRSGTRREELLLDEATLRQVWLLRRMAQMISSDEKQYGEGIEKLLGHLKKSRSNTEFLANLGKDM